MMGRGLIFRRKASEEVLCFYHDVVKTVVLSGISPSFPGLSPASGQVTYVLLTRPPLIQDTGLKIQSAPCGYSVKSRNLPSLYPESCILDPFDLHVLGTPPAFVLSQDQTLI